MKTWCEFREMRPELAEAGQALFYQVGVGLAFLATARPDGRPRLHPMCPVLDGDGLYAFIVPSPKQRDLQRDGLYSMHSFPCDDNEDAFMVTGTARLVRDEALRSKISDQFVAERAQFSVPAPEPDHLLFAFDLDGALLTRTTGHGDPAPQHTIWKA